MFFIRKDLLTTAQVKGHQRVISLQKGMTMNHQLKAPDLVDGYAIRSSFYRERDSDYVVVIDCGNLFSSESAGFKVGTIAVDESPTVTGDGMSQKVRTGFAWLSDHFGTYNDAVTVFLRLCVEGEQQHE